MKVALIPTLILILVALAPAQEKLKHAVDQYRAGEYAAAAAELEKLNSSGERNHQIYLYLGAAYARLGKASDARVAFGDALKVKTAKNIDGEAPPKIHRNNAPDSSGVPEGYRSGKMVLAVEFKSDKTVGLSFVVSTTTTEFVKNCVEAAKQIKFDPAISNGAPVTVIKLLEYTFKRH